MFRLTLLNAGVITISLFCAFGLWISSKSINDSFKKRFHKNEIEQKFGNRSKYGKMTLREALKIASHETKIILEWCHPRTELHGMDKRKCGKCKVSNDKSLITHPDTTAVVFNKFCGQRTSMPPDYIRRPDHLYIWKDDESPSSTIKIDGVTLDDFEENYFNATQTYRRDSDFYSPYHGSIFILENLPKYKHLYNINKTRTAAWFVSNCGHTDGARKRMKLFESLKDSGLKVDVAGRCFSKLFAPRRGTEEFYKFLAKYKFYLAFENSYHCRDYITEKFYQHGLIAGTIPIVFGAKREDYEAIAPPHSFIHVEDFKDSKELYNYLNYLDSNDSAYKEYFVWRKPFLERSPDFLQLHRTGHCELCRVLHGIDVGPRSHQSQYFNPDYNRDEGEMQVKKRRSLKKMNVKSLRDWWYGEDNPECFKLTNVV